MNLKKKVLAAAACAALIAVVTPQARAADGVSSGNWYVGLSGGWDAPRDTDWSKTAQRGNINNGNGWDGAISIGTNINKYFSTELEASYHHNAFDSLHVNGTAGSRSTGGHADVWGFMLNGTFDMLPTQLVSPYLTAGAGVGVHSTSINSVPALAFTGGNGTDTTFAYKGGGGLNFHVAEKTDLFLGYQYFGTTDAKLTGIKYSYGVHEARAGVRFHF